MHSSKKNIYISYSSPVFENDCALINVSFKDLFSMFLGTVEIRRTLFFKKSVTRLQSF